MRNINIDPVIVEPSKFLIKFLNTCITRIFHNLFKKQKKSTKIPFCSSPTVGDSFKLRTVALAILYTMILNYYVYKYKTSRDIPCQLLI
jgi:hypothetical protein